MATFTSFGQVVSDWKHKYTIKNVQRYALTEAGTYLRDFVRQQHGSSQLRANSALTVAIKRGDGPLRDKGSLANAVQFLVRGDTANVFSTKNYLAHIHEYGRRWKMSDKQRRYLMYLLSSAGMTPKGSRLSKSGSSGGGYITIPPRPIWRKAILETRVKIVLKVSKIFNDAIKN